MNKQTDFEWRNYVVQPNDDEEEPMGDEFFVNSESLTNVSSLVRESIQNSIDARKDPSQPVRMRFHVGRMSAQNKKKYISNLEDHIDSALGHPLAKIDEISARYLIVEDFNTKGLKGRTTSKRPIKDPAEPDKDSYWFFEWKTGESNKDTNSGGKWGVGKVVFSFVSQVKTYFVFSSRDLESAPAGNTDIFFGHNIMKTHDLNDNQRCKPKHRLMQIENNDWVPYGDAGLIEDFVKDWSLKRKIGETGTSILMPYCFNEFDAKSLTQAIAQDYFIALLDGVLECEISDEFGNQIVQLNKETLITNIQELPNDLQTEATKTKDELVQLCNLYGAKNSEKATRIFISVDSDTPNNWKKIEFGEEKQEEIISTLNSLHPIIFDIEVLLPQRKNPKHFEKAIFQVFLQKRESIRLRTTYCRQGILVPDAGKGLPIPTDYVSLVYAPTGPISDFLSAAEDPSHKSWSSKQKNFKDFYKPEEFSRDALTFMRMATNQLIQSTLNMGDKKDQTSLSKYFPMANSGVPISVDQISPKIFLSKTIDKKRPTRVSLTWRVENFSHISTKLIRVDATPLIEELADNPLEYNLTLESLYGSYEYFVRVSDGTKSIDSNHIYISPTLSRAAKVAIAGEDGNFSIENIDEDSVKVGESFVLTVAYDLRDGKPFDSWKIEDFALTNKLTKRKTRGLEITLSENKAVFTVLERKFSAHFSGFDINRDLVFSVDMVD